MRWLAIGTLIGATILTGGAAAAGAAAAGAGGLALLTSAATFAGAGLEAFQGIEQGRAQASELQQQKLQAQAQATQAAIEEDQRQKQLRSVLASQNALFGQAGIDLSSGTPVGLAQDSYNNAQQQTNQAAAFNAVTQAQLAMQQQDTARASTISSLNGVTTGLSSMVKFGMNQAQIGRIPRINPNGTYSISGGWN